MTPSWDAFLVIAALAVAGLALVGGRGAVLRVAVAGYPAILIADAAGEIFRQFFAGPGAAVTLWPTADLAAVATVKFFAMAAALGLEFFLGDHPTPRDFKSHTGRVGGIAALAVATTGFFAAGLLVLVGGGSLVAFRAPDPAMISGFFVGAPLLAGIFKAWPIFALAPGVIALGLRERR